MLVVRRQDLDGLAQGAQPAGLAGQALVIEHVAGQLQGRDLIGARGEELGHPPPRYAPALAAVGIDIVLGIGKGLGQGIGHALGRAAHDTELAFDIAQRDADMAACHACQAQEINGFGE